MEIPEPHNAARHNPSALEWIQQSICKRIEQILMAPSSFAKNTKIGSRALIHYQRKQQKTVEAYFQEVPEVKVQSYFRSPLGEWDLDLRLELSKREGKNCIVLLYPSVVGIPDVCQAMPDFTHQIGTVLASTRYIWVYKLSIGNILSKGTISWYIIHTIDSIKDQIFENQPIEVIIVRNATRDDFIATARHGWTNTVLVVGGHGDIRTACLTDGSVCNKDVLPVVVPLKAFVQHTCAQWDPIRSLGKPWAETVYGWNRGTSPIDFIHDPLPVRSKRLIESKKNPE